MGPVTRKLVAWTRLVHLCCSMLALAAIIFFAVTGFILNNEEMFGLGQPPDRIEVKGMMPVEMVRRADQEEIVSYLRETFSVRGEVEKFSVPVDSEGEGVLLPGQVAGLTASEGEIYLTFTRPGGQCEVTINRSDGRMKITTDPPSVLTALVDLHRGKSAGPVWAVLMDTAALCLLLACLSGIVLCLATPKRRILGLTALALGLAAWLGAYLLFTPK